MVVFEWDPEKNLINLKKHGVSFEEAQYVFSDKDRVIIKDSKHSESEERIFCIGKVNSKIITVRFTYRDKKIRIFGAGEWRKGKIDYEKNQKAR